MQRGAGVGAQADDVAGVGGNLGVVEDDVKQAGTLGWEAWG